MTGYPRLQFVFLIFLLASMCTIRVSMACGEGCVAQKDCPAACDYRCSKADYHRKACLMFCNLCCNKCLCVPSGTAGNKEECPCYNNWKTKEGGPKCP
ncbi:hypothetical protein RHMOL_Rhmol13G0058000 [Rhododendron molle]|uniref:Uncharacterized protein n=1 Tax=Rhododendron molle TaxID=49168 RepID=A0ACC0L4I0_RHOML|nr:hypothetical protein RHMOL_Rhmol13G0058000 [Rhododendron molle]